MKRATLKRIYIYVPRIHTSEAQRQTTQHVDYHDLDLLYTTEKVGSCFGHTDVLGWEKHRSKTITGQSCNVSKKEFCGEFRRKRSIHRSTTVFPCPFFWFKLHTSPLQHQQKSTTTKIIHWSSPWITYPTRIHTKKLTTNRSRQASSACPMHHLTCCCTDGSSLRFSDLMGLCLALLLFFVFVVFLLVRFTFLLFLLVLRLLEET